MYKKISEALKNPSFYQLLGMGMNKILKFFRQHITYQAVLILSLISFSTSYYGFISLVSDGLLLTKILFFAVVAVIQLALVYSISQLYIQEFFSRHVLRAFLLLITYLLSLFISVLFSFNFYYKIFSASEFSQRNVTLQLEGVKHGLEDAQSSFDSVYLSLKKLSDYSMVQSIEERTYGGTCDETKIPTPGPRSALREAESKLFQSHLSSFEELKIKIISETAIIKKMLIDFNPKKDDVDKLEEQVNSKIAQINRIFRGGEITLLPKILEKHNGSKRMQMESLGRTISCPDSQISLKINTIGENLNALKMLKKVSFFDANNQQQLIERTINVLLAILPFTSTHVVALDKVSSPTDVTQSDIKAIGLGFLVDFFIFFFTILAKEPYRARFFTHESILQYLRYDIRRVLKPFVFESHFSYHLIIPNQRKNHKIDEILTRFKMDKMITLVGNNVEYDELLFLHQSKLKNFDKFTFKVYKLDKQKYNTLLVYIDELHHNA
jgi:DNA-binding transcriptional regulator GbsR (MarR family)